MCPTNEFLNTSQVWPTKTTEKVKAAVMKAAAGRNGRGWAWMMMLKQW
jgi:hypothetical protein